MQIKVHNFYQNTKGQKVQAGVYNASNLPQGLASYLVHNDLATIVNDIPDTPAGNALKEQNEPAQTPSQETTSQSANELSLEDLQAAYLEATGKKPDGRWSFETLQDKLDELI